MKISEILNEEEIVSGALTSIQDVKQHPKYQRPVNRNLYTPGKAALDKEYDQVEKFTKTSIPCKQKQLDDPRN